jgi:SUN domain-containing protein 1/2
MESMCRVVFLAITGLIVALLIRDVFGSMIVEAYEGEIASSMSASQELLGDPLDDAFLAETISILNNLGDLQQLRAQIDQLEHDQARVVHDLKVLDGLLSQVKRKQLNAFIQKLTEIETVELARREAESVPVTLASAGASQGPVALDVSTEELDSFFDAESILAESDADIAAWTLTVLKDETRKLLEFLQVPSEAASIDAPTVDADNCTSPGVAMLQVHRAVHQFANDGIGLKDHAHGSTILYDRTSETYQPASADTLGSVWWSRFIPEDWERWLLPDGWQEWNAMPLFLSHTFGSSNRRGSLFRADVSPPSAIFHGNTLPGSCWPMAGSSGRVTFQLPYPVKLSAVSLEHASALLLTNKALMSSAAKKLAVYGYPACQQSCRGLGFDEHRRMLLATIEYDKDRGGIQTFNVRSPAPGKPSASCAAVAEAHSPEMNSAGSCSAPPSAESAAEPVVGIEVVVLENWGNVDYTCLYRFRVHGEATKVGSR